MLRILLIKKDESTMANNFKALNIIGTTIIRIVKLNVSLMLISNQHANAVIDILSKQQKNEINC